MSIADYRPCVGLVSLLLLTSPTLLGQKLSVTVFDSKTGQALKDLTAQNFDVTDGKLPLTVQSAEYREEPLDIMVVADASFLGEVIRPIVSPVVRRLPSGAQMALVTYDQSATLVQDLTDSEERLLAGSAAITYGNNPRALDALYAAIDGGFSGSPGRRVVVLLSSGVEGRSRTKLSEVITLARQHDVAIFVAFADGTDSHLFQQLAGNTGGAWFHLKKLGLSPNASADLIYSAMAGSYELDISGVDQFGDRLKVKITGLQKSKMKIVVSIRPVD